MTSEVIRKYLYINVDELGPIVLQDQSQLPTTLLTSLNRFPRSEH